MLVNFARFKALSSFTLTGQSLDIFTLQLKRVSTKQLTPLKMGTRFHILRDLQPAHPSNPMLAASQPSILLEA